MANAISSTGNFVHSLRSTPKRGAFAKRHVGEGVGGKAISGDSFQISGVWGSKRLPEPEAFSNPRTGDVISESGRVRATELLSLMHNYRYAVGPRPDKQARHVNPDLDVEQQQIERTQLAPPPARKLPRVAGCRQGRRHSRP